MVFLLQVLFLMILINILSFYQGSSEVMIDFKFDMAAPTSSHMVGRCFVATETGTYFDGTGFVKAGETTLRPRPLKGNVRCFSLFAGHVLYLKIKNVLL